MTVQTQRTVTADDGDAELDDEFLREAAATLAQDPDALPKANWDAIGQYVSVLAKRHARKWPSNPSEYRGGFYEGVILALRRNPQEFAQSRRPWGLLVTKGKLAGQSAVAAQATGGMVDRDPDTHHVRFANVPTVTTVGNLRDIEPFIVRKLT